MSQANYITSNLRLYINCWSELLHVDICCLCVLTERIYTVEGRKWCTHSQDGWNYGKRARTLSNSWV